MNLIRRYFLFL